MASVVLTHGVVRTSRIRTHGATFRQISLRANTLRSVTQLDTMYTEIQNYRMAHTVHSKRAKIILYSKKAKIYD